MANARSAWGIDIGNRALKAIKLVRDGDQVRIDDYEILEHEQVLSNAGDNRESLIQTALTNFVARHATRGAPVAIGVSGQQSFARFIKLPPVEPRKIPEIVRFEAIQQIPFPLDDVEWAYQLFQSPDSPDVEVGIFAMRKELVNQHIQYFTDVELNVQVVQMSPLAVYNAMGFEGRIRETTMIIDLGAENTDLIIADGETIWLRSIPIGGNNFTEALVKSFKLNFPKAEELKRNAASSKYARQIFQAMRPVFADLVSEIQRSIGFYASVHRDSRIQKVIAVGATFRLPGLQKYLQQNLQLDVERLDSLGAGTPADGKSGAAFSENLLSMVSAYGLALQAMGEGKIESSLLPAAIRRAKVWRDKTKWFAAAAALFVVGTGVAYSSCWLTGKAAEVAQQRNDSEITQVQNQATALSSRWQAVETAGAKDREQIKNTLALLKYRDTWANVLTDLYQAMPQPQPEVVKAYQAADKSKVNVKSLPPRDERRMIILDKIDTAYVPDLRAGRPGAAPSAPGTAMRGFAITLRGTTPYSGAKFYRFIDEQFMDALRAHNTSAIDPVDGQFECVKKGYAIVSATCVKNGKVGEDTERLNILKQSFDAAMRGVPAPGAAGHFGAYGNAAECFDLPADAPAMPAPDVAPGFSAATMAESWYLDRVTGEDVRSDTWFIVQVFIQLDPKPAATPPAGQPAASPVALETTH